MSYSDPNRFNYRYSPASDKEYPAAYNFDGYGNLLESSNSPPSLKNVSAERY